MKCQMDGEEAREFNFLIDWASSPRKLKVLVEAVKLIVTPYGLHRATCSRAAIAKAEVADFLLLKTSLLILFASPRILSLIAAKVNDLCHQNSRRKRQA